MTVTINKKIKVLEVEDGEGDGVGIIHDGNYLLMIDEETNSGRHSDRMKRVPLSNGLMAFLWERKDGDED